MSSNPKIFKIQAYSQKEMLVFYAVTWKTFKGWIEKIELGEYSGKKFTPAQVKKIVDHIGEPN